MKEDLLHYVWKTKSFRFSELRTTENEQLHIEKFGIHNSNAGPDFLEGKINIDGTSWIGHIEMHVFSSEWIRHEHHLDSSYNNVILHVVWEEDEIIYLPDGTRIPCLELKELLPVYLIEGYNRFKKRTELIVCSSELQHGDKDLFLYSLNKLAIERLEQKSLPISIELEENGQDWSQLLFLLISKSLGLKVNVDGMEALAHSIPHRLLLKHVDNLFQIEAILFGQAGMLSENWEDDYPKRLGKEYLFLQQKYGLKPLNNYPWKLLRMRPTSFPSIRIAQLAMLYFRNPDLHNRILEAEHVSELMALFDESTSEYWEDHFLFDRPSKRIPKHLGKATKQNILINAVIPFLFSYGQYRADDRYVERAIEFMSKIPSEQNVILKQWEKLGIIADSSYQSQALIQLYKEYCIKGRCLECHYGNQVLKQISSFVKEEHQMMCQS